MDEFTPPWPDRPLVHTVTTPVEDLAVVRALTDRVVLLEEILRRLTYRNGDGAICSAVHGDWSLEPVLDSTMYWTLDRLHPPLADEEGT